MHIKPAPWLEKMKQSHVKILGEIPHQVILTCLVFHKYNSIKVACIRYGNGDVGRVSTPYNPGYVSMNLAYKDKNIPLYNQFKKKKKEFQNFGIAFNHPVMESDP